MLPLPLPLPPLPGGWLLTRAMSKEGKYIFLWRTGGHAPREHMRVMVPTESTGVMTATWALPGLPLAGGCRSQEFGYEGSDTPVLAPIS